MTKKRFVIFFSFGLMCFVAISWNSLTFSQDSCNILIPVSVQEYIQDHPDNSASSESLGSVSSGSLKNGKLMPWCGTNFTYFDTTSYLNSRAYVHQDVRDAVLDVYQQFELLQPHRHFRLMECSNREGGEMFPHHTHQNGLSIDFMSPLIQNNTPYYGLDTTGIDHYWLDFNDQGQWKKDTSVNLDFNLIAQHILILEQTARKYGLKIAKVIFKIELKDELFATAYGTKLAETKIYFAQNLPNLINELHDDHYHIDFAFI